MPAADEEILHRRNSTVRMVPSRWVEKSYHARFTARAELEAYRALDQVLPTGVRRPKIHAIEEANNLIRMEYIRGPSLLQASLRQGAATYEGYRETLLALFVAAWVHKLRFDSDPSNMLIADTGGLVIIDPVCADLELPDFAMVVFLVGMLKAFLRSGIRLKWSGYMRCWKRYYARYLELTGGDYRHLNQQISRYIATVIEWNLQESGTETRSQRVVRRLVLVPIWSLLALLFRWNVVRT